MTSVPWAWTHSSARTNAPGRSTTAPGATERFRSVNGRSRLGTNSATASVMCVTRMAGNKGARSGIGP